MASNPEKHIRQQYFAITKQSVWASPSGLDDSYYIMPFDAGSFKPIPAVDTGQLNYYSSAGIMKQDSRNNVDSLTGLHRIPFSGVAMLERIAPLFMGAFQSVVEDAGTPYAKNFTPADTVLDFTQNDGMMHTIILGNYSAAIDSGSTTSATANKLVDSGATFSTTGVEIGDTVENGDTSTFSYVTAIDSETQLTLADNIFAVGGGGEAYAIVRSDMVRFTECLIDNLTFSVSNRSNGIDRYAKVSGEWISRRIYKNQYPSSVTKTALPASPTILNDSADYFTLNMVLTSSVGALTLSNLPWFNFTMQINNNVTPNGQTTGGMALNYRIAPTITYTIDLPYNDDTFKALEHYIRGSNVAFDFGNGDGNTSGTFKIDGEKGVLTDNPYEFDGDYHMIRFQFEALKPTSAGWNAQYVGFADAVDWGY
uniref:Uncharacterized protein n=1 Tax=viral metagenome TaxID=1070528 RepID=A0A6M3IKU1_9ZZZZ